jgi:hypothetical protein
VGVTVGVAEVGAVSVSVSDGITVGVDVALGVGRGVAVPSVAMLVPAGVALASANAVATVTEPKAIAATLAATDRDVIRVRRFMGVLLSIGVRRGVTCSRLTVMVCDETSASSG